MRNLTTAGLLVALIIFLGIEEDHDRLRARVQRLEMQVAYLQSRPPPKAPLVDLSELDAGITESHRRLESLCLALGVVARTASGRERIPGDISWCTHMPARTGGARVWRKEGWDVSDEEAAQVRAKFRTP